MNNSELPIPSKDVPSEDRSTRVIPLAQKIIAAIDTEADALVQIAAFDVAKVAIDHRRMMLKKKPVSDLTKKVMEALI